MKARAGDEEEEKVRKMGGFRFGWGECGEGMWEIRGEVDGGCGWR